MTSPLTEAPGILARLGLEATHQHITLLNRKREQLHAAQLAAEDQFLHNVARVWREGRLTEPELALTYRAYADFAVTGYGKRWNAAVGVDHRRLANLMRQPGMGQPNMPDGTWRGHWPVSDGDSLPASGVCVVYVLYDAANEPCYVGSSSNVRNRLRDHRSDGKPFAWWSAFACADREAAYQLEERLLSEYLPYLNKKRGR